MTNWRNPTDVQQTLFLTVVLWIMYALFTTAWVLLRGIVVAGGALAIVMYYFYLVLLNNWPANVNFLFMTALTTLVLITAAAWTIKSFSVLFKLKE